jgi:hypothetical protein
MNEIRIIEPRKNLLPGEHVVSISIPARKAPRPLRPRRCKFEQAEARMTDQEFWLRATWAGL